MKTPPSAGFCLFRGYTWNSPLSDGNEMHNMSPVLRRNAFKADGCDNL